MKLLILLAILNFGACELKTLTNSNFTESIKEGFWFVRFYAVWCSKCKAMKPEWDELSNYFNETINFGDIDCHEHQQVCNEQDINGYPILKFYENGKYKATCPRSFVRRDMEQFAVKMINQPVQVYPPSVVKQSIGTDNTKALLLLLSPNLDPSFEQVAKDEYASLARYVYINTSEAIDSGEEQDLRELLSLLGFQPNEIPSTSSSLRSFSFIIASSRAGACNIRYPLPLSHPQHSTRMLTHWISTAEFSFVPEFSSQVNEAVKKEGRRVVFAVLNGTENPDSHVFLDGFRKLGVKIISEINKEKERQYIIKERKEKENKGEENDLDVEWPLFFAFVDAKKLPFFTSFFHVKGTGYPLIFIHDFGTRETFSKPSSTRWTFDSIESFIHSVESGEISPDPEEKEDEGNKKIKIHDFFGNLKGDSAESLKELIMMHKESVLVGVIVLLLCAFVAISVAICRTSQDTEEKGKERGEEKEEKEEEKKEKVKDVKKKKSSKSEKND